MEILNKTENGLKRSCNVLLSKEDLDAARNTKLRDIAKKVRLDGFRPGKAPLDILKRIYGESVESEAKKQAITDACKKFLNDEKPALSLSYVTEIVKDEQDSLEFLIKYEIIPSFELKEVSDLEVVKHLPEITDKEVDDFLESIRKDAKNWIEDNGGGKIKEGQKVAVNLTLLSPGKKPRTNILDNLEIILGNETVLEDFWKPFIGAKVSDTVEFSVNYPENFHEKSLSGKSVAYKAVVNKVFNHAEYKLDDDFAKAIGCDNLEKAKEWAKARVVSKYEYIAKDVMRRDLLDRISEQYDFDVPQNMTELEGRVIRSQIEEEAKKLGKEFSPRVQEECRKLSEQRVRLGFVIAEIAKREKITVSREEIYQAIKHIASLYPGQEKAIWQKYSRGDSIQAVIGPILEDKVINFLYGKIKIKEEKRSIEDLIALDEEEFDFFKDEEDDKSKESKKEEKPKRRKAESEPKEKLAENETESAETKKTKRSSQKIKEEKV
ncbi:MAG: trigger factor [Holosporaceae bacterium]|jgi:trigger factor|nr:trigger factor [Holosporaceae bacterium]